MDFSVTYSGPGKSKLEEVSGRLNLLSGWVMVFPFVWRYRTAIATGNPRDNVVEFRWEYGPARVCVSRPRNTSDKF